MGWDCDKCGIRVQPGSSNANECAVSVLVQYAMHLHVVPHAAHLCASLRYEFKYVTDVCVVCRRCVLYQLPRHSANKRSLPPACSVSACFAANLRYEK